MRTSIALLADVNKMIFEGKVDEGEVGKIRKGCHWKLPLELMITGSSMPYWIISL
jgi:HlyD family secretion protein